MAQEGLISVILPTHNGSRYLAESIRSVLAQTYWNLELIVVDDGSTDTTPEILDRLAAEDNRMRVVRHKRNRRLPAALNTGFDRATGEFLTWTSDDNLYQPEALEVMAGFLTANPVIDFVYTDFTVIDEEGRPVREETVGPAENLVNRNCVGPCFLYRQTAKQRVGRYAEDLFLAEDYDFWLRMWSACAMRPLHRSLYHYREHRSSLTQMNADGRAQRMWAEALARNLPTLPGLSRWEKSRTFLHLAQGARWRGNSIAWGRYLTWAAICSPRVTAAFAWSVLRRRWSGRANWLAR